MRLLNTMTAIATLGALGLAGASGCNETAGDSGSGGGGDSDSSSSSSSDSDSVSCGAEQMRCEGRCVEISSDPDNCGACGEVCSDSEVCSEGECTDSCKDDETNCDRACVDTDNSTNHCGACDNACDPGQLCDAGVCDDVPDSRDVPDPGEPGFDPSVDPGIHPAFIDDPDLTRNEDYVYVATKAGDHDLPAGIVAIDYDVMGSDDLKAVLTSHLSELQGGYGLALYLLNGTELNDTDLDFLQMLHDESKGLGLDNLDTLHVYNLKSLRGGVESDSVTAYGIPYPFLWSNGWQGTDNSEMHGDGGWVKHIVMDDLEEIKAGTFCDTMFESMSFKGVTMVREMGLGFAPHGPATYIYMPSVVEVEQHAFRRRQYVLKYNFPKMTHAGRFAFDDNSRMLYFNAPLLINPDTGDNEDTRNTFNDPRDLIAFNFPNLEFTGLAFLGGTNDTTTIFRFPSVVDFEGASLRGHSNVRFVWAPEATRMGPNTFIDNALMTDVYAPKVEVLGRYAFDGCTSLTHLELPSALDINNNAFDGSSLEELHLPAVELLREEAFLNVTTLKRLYLGDTPPEQKVDVFTGTSADLVIYYSGDDADWASWSPVGNASATVVHE